MNHEEEPAFNARVDGQEVNFRREDLSVHTFAGRLAVFNHVFAVFDHEGQKAGVWTYQDEPSYVPMLQFAQENNCLMVLNADEVSPLDEETYISKNTRDLKSTDYIPEEWV